jgi:hypothetical protein
LTRGSSRVTRSLVRLLPVVKIPCNFGVLSVVLASDQKSNLVIGHMRGTAATSADVRGARGACSQDQAEEESSGNRPLPSGSGFTLPEVDDRHQRDGYSANWDEPTDQRRVTGDASPGDASPEDIEGNVSVRIRSTTLSALRDQSFVVTTPEHSLQRPAVAPARECPGSATYFTTEAALPPRPEVRGLRAED